MRFYITDCFAEEKYQGNPLLAVIADKELSDEEQWQITKEIGFSESVFIDPVKHNGGYNVRIWMPHAGEVPFAGHPVLGAAWVIRYMLETEEEGPVILHLPLGDIPVAVQGDRLFMSQKEPVFGDCVSAEEAAAAFGISADDIDHTYPVQRVSTGLASVIIPLKERETLSRIRTRRDAFDAYKQKYPQNACTHIFFVRTGEAELAARCMTEDYREDPATGSANGNLAGYLLQYDFFGARDISWTVKQGEDMGRPSLLYVHGRHTDDTWTIEVGGRCCLVASGEWK